VAGSSNLRNLVLAFTIHSRLRFEHFRFCHKPLLKKHDLQDTQTCPVAHDGLGQVQERRTDTSVGQSLWRGFRLGLFNPASLAGAFCTSTRSVGSELQCSNPKNGGRKSGVSGRSAAVEQDRRTIFKMEPSSNREREIARCVDTRAKQGKVPISVISEIAPTIPFIMSESETQFLIKYIIWRRDHPIDENFQT